MRAHPFGLGLGVVILAAVAAEAQQGSSAIRGRVLDQQQAVLPGVAILVTHQDSGIFRAITTGPDGTFSASSLVPGPYRVIAELTGFRRLTREDLRLEVGRTLTLELELQVGAVEESLTVTGVAPQVDLTSAQVSGNVAQDELTELPSPVRSFYGFIALLPGVQYAPSISSSDRISVNGQSTTQVVYLFDGGQNNDDMRGGSSGAQTRPALEAVQEFQLITNQFDAEYGKSSGGGVVNAITKSGTNSSKGSTFGYYTASNFAARNFFDKQQGLGNPDTQKQQWGGTLGGPIVRNKAHYFFSLERVDYEEGLSRSYPSRPDLSFSTTQDSEIWNTLIRADHQLNSKNTYGFRWLREGLVSIDQPVGNATAETLRNEWDVDNTALVTYNTILGNKVNTIRASVTQENVQRGTSAYRDSGRQDLQPPTLTHLSFYQGASDVGYHRIQTSYNFDDTFSWFVPGKRGDHDLKFGFQYVFADNLTREQGTLNGNFTFPSDRPFNAADPSTYPERLSIRVPGPENLLPETHMVGLYAQDKWRLNNRLTLSLGLRYDIAFANLTPSANPLFDDPNDSSLDRNNIQPRFGVAYNAGGTSVIRGGYGMFYEGLWHANFEPYMRTGVFSDSFVANFPVSTPDPGPSQGRLPSEPLLGNGPVMNRDLLGGLFPPGTRARNSSTVFLDHPDRRLSYSQQASMGYERQLAPQFAFSADYAHTWGRDVPIAYNLVPALRANTTRTGPLTRFDLLELAGRLGISPFQNNVLIRENIGRAETDSLNVQIEKRFSNLWGARASYAYTSSRGNTNGAITYQNQFQVLAERNLDLNWGPTDSDRTHIVSLSGRVEVPRTRGLSVGAVFRTMSGQPITIHNTNIDADRNGILFDPLPAGTYSGVGENAMTVENKGGRNGARGPGYAQLDLRITHRVPVGGNRGIDIFGEIFNVTNEPNFANPTGDLRSPSFLVPTTLFGEVTRQAQVGLRFAF